MWAAVGINTGKVYMLSDYKSTLFLRLQQSYKSNTNINRKNTYPEPLIIQRSI